MEAARRWHRVCSWQPLSVVVELDAPAPLAAVRGVPPVPQDSNLATRKHHREPDIGRPGPAVLAADGPTLADEQRHGECCRALAYELIAEGELPANVIPHLDAELRRCCMQEQAIGVIEGAAAKGDAASGRVGVPEIPYFHAAMIRVADGTFRIFEDSTVARSRATFASCESLGSRTATPEAAIERLRRRASFQS